MSSSGKGSSSQNNTIAQSSASAGQNVEDNRRARRKRDKANSEAGPSGSHIESTNAPKTDIPSKEQNSFGDTDFIAFTFSDEEDQDVEDRRPEVREWDKGKSRTSDRDHTGRKRKVDDSSLDDGYANKKQRVAAASRKAPWVADIDWDSCTNVAEMLHRDVEAFVNYISPTPEENEVRSLVVALITRAVTQAFPDAEVHPFGSYDTKLYLPVGDIDLVVHSQSMAYSKKEAVLHSIANTMKRAGITDRVRIISKAKVPIVKFVTLHGNIPVDISINQGNGVTAGTMIKHFLAELPALRSLVLIVKSFLSQRSMNEVYTGGLGSYSIVCLVISFLQMHPKIRRGEIDPSKNLGVLVMEFFELYGCYFNYKEVGISIREGGTYFNKTERGWQDFSQPRLLSIEDPGDLSNDISKGSYGIVKVRTTLAGAHGIMTAAAYAQAKIISAKREGRYTRLRDTHTDQRSILSSVMGVTQETINHRRLVQEVYDRQVLHRMLGVAPQAGVALHAQTNGQSRVAHEKSVKTAWEAVDMELESNDERHASGDESRYKTDDRRQPPRKRRKTGREQDMHTVYTTDDEEQNDERTTAVAGRRGLRSFHFLFFFQMASTRASITPVNLKDRIAALQQRNGSTSQADHKLAPVLPNSTRSLRDKIASFEKQGAVPVPRGSFGLGAPPVDDGSSRRRGEMMGNRVPGLSRPMVPVSTNGFRPTSPEFSGGRSRSASISDVRIASPPLGSLSPPLSAVRETLDHTPMDDVNGPRFPSTLQVRTERRSVSDVLPRSRSPTSIDAPVPVEEEEAENLSPKSVFKISELDQHLEDVEPHRDLPPQPALLEADSGRLSSNDTASTSTAAESKDICELNAKDSSLPPSVDDTTSLTGQECDDINQVVVGMVESENKVSNITSAEMSTSGTVHLPELQAKSVDVQVRSTINATLGDWDEVFTLNDPTIVSCMAPSTEIVEKKLEPVTSSIVVSEAQDVVPVVLPSSSVLSLDLNSYVNANAAVQPPLKPKNDNMDVDDLVDQSLALDTADAVIVTEPARVVSPVVTRAILIPVPPGLSSGPSSGNTSPVSDALAPSEPSLTPKTTSNSFRAVVHRKVADGASNRVPSPPPAESLPRWTMTTAEPPQSPGFGDLADLVASAAMLEQQLSGLGSPTKNMHVDVPHVSSTPTPPLEKPEHLVPDIELTSAEQHSPVQDIPASSGSSQYDTPQEFPSSIPESSVPGTPSRRDQVTRSRLLSDTPPPVPPKSPRPRYFSTLLPRRPSANGMLSMPGAYPRTSVCSEMSEDDSVLVSTPPSPRFDSHGSDTSSIMSSSRSWKLPKKGLARATSFADKLLPKRNNRHTVVLASPGKQHLAVRNSWTTESCILNLTDPAEHGHLSSSVTSPRTPSPTPTLPRFDLSPSPDQRRSAASPMDRPSSWISISSTGSGGLDSALFDAFPSVPDGVPLNPSLPPQSESAHLSPSGHLSSSGFTARSATLPSRSSYQKPRSARI
ncbi:uncharacterized protein FIBRA_08704 [Fibroporia radiculosa]|uniref:polynucleotide adenylyltransferase n=1 Tax=Fibroporia radiculosa TaxID=599839 RepID=J4I373_9APHY|nr:uncharacterized protein FIBRA_08704 [Fibroporia radiculosa]CCM06442.1 predicted protein [Fibroporia radiculosa]